MGGSQQQQPPPAAEEPERPEPIVGLAGTFDQGADPEALRTAASVMRALALRAGAACRGGVART
jgi:hypothetical protein